MKSRPLPKGSHNYDIAEATIKFEAVGEQSVNEDENKSRSM